VGAMLSYIGETGRRLAALHARFAAGKLPAAPRRRPTPRPAGEPGGAAQAGAEQARAGAAAARRGPGIPPGPPGLVFREYGFGVYAEALRGLLDDPEMRALLAASPQAGRLLRPLWQRLTTEELPEVLRPPPRPRKPRKPRQPRASWAPASGPPGLRRVRLPDGTRAWEPIPCYPAGEPPSRRARARPRLPPEPEPPRPARPPPKAPRPPNPERRLSDYNWIGRLFMR
ncbi:MAG: hypothetical protein J0H14_19565, partial [Alphaproteobacteria bacterium]|nr:hypothetical protein [Alphaproteobacteria bacterium]